MGATPWRFESSPEHQPSLAFGETTAWQASTTPADDETTAWQASTTPADDETTPGQANPPPTSPFQISHFRFLLYSPAPYLGNTAPNRKMDPVITIG